MKWKYVRSAAPNAESGIPNPQTPLILHRHNKVRPTVQTNQKPGVGLGQNPVLVIPLQVPSNFLSCLTFTLEPVSQVSHTKTNSTMIYSSSEATLEKGLGRKGNICSINSPLTHTHKDIFCSFLLKNILKDPLLHTLCVFLGKPSLSKGGHKDSPLRSWGAADHGPLPFMAHRRIWLKIIASQPKFGKQDKFSAWKLGILDNQSSRRKSGKPDFLIQTNKPAHSCYVSVLW